MKYQGLIASVMFIVAGCASSNDVVVERPVDEIFSEAMAKYTSQDYRGASNLFDQVDQFYPWSPLSIKAQLLAPYSHYMDKEYTKAIEGFNRFIELHPAHPEAAYAAYLKGLSYYYQFKDYRFDSTPTEQAKATFLEVVNRYPNSGYSEEAKYRITVCDERLAAKELDVGRFYLDGKKYISAAGRFRNIYTQYPNTRSAPEAVRHLVTVYRTLGSDAEADRTAAILEQKYPGSPEEADLSDLESGFSFNPFSGNFNIPFVK